MKTTHYLLLLVSFIGSSQAYAITPAQERFCRQQAQDAMFMGQFEARMTYENCISSIIQHEMNQMDADNCVRFGISCSSRSGSSPQRGNKPTRQDCENDYAAKQARNRDADRDSLDLNAIKAYRNCLDRAE